MRRREREQADLAHSAAASAWLHEVGAALDERPVLGFRDVMPATALVAVEAEDRPAGKVRPLRARRLEAAT